MRVTTPGRLMMERAVPEKYRDRFDVLDEKALKKLATEIAKNDPDLYADFIGNVADVSREVVYRHGREASVGLEDLKLPKKLVDYRNALREQVNAIIVDSSIDPKERQEKIINMLRGEITNIPKEVLKAFEGSRNGLAEQTRSGARGNPNQLMQVLFGDVLVVDAKDRPVPIAGLHSYGEGVTPLEYWASSSGARKGSVSVQFSTAQGGYLGKQLSNIGHRVVVTQKDCGTKAGIPVKGNDPDNVGSLLAAPVKGHQAGEMITEDMLDELGDSTIRVRSVATCALGDGVCAHCAGVREGNTLPPIGSHVGVIGSRAMSEPITQAGLKCLDPYTLVRMADWSVKELKDITVGEYVMGSNIKGECSPTRVLGVYDNGIQPMFKYTYKKGWGREEVSMVATSIHKILSVTSKTSCKEEALNYVPRMLPAGYKGRRVSAVLVTAVDGKDPIISAGKRVREESLGMGRAMDLAVDNEDHLFVLANGLIVSNTKHSGGVASSDDKQVSGFKEMDQFLQVPATFQGAATLSTVDGKVTSVKPAPAGGTFVYVNSEEHYVPRGTAVTAKPGDTVYAGDTLSDGIPNPAELVQYKGIGEGRRYFVDKYREILERNKASVHRRNLEIVARGFVNRVVIDKPEGYHGYIYGDVVPYDQFASDYTPRDGSKDIPIGQSINQYMEKPYLHYTIGTRITPHVIKDLKEGGISSVLVNKETPVFKPHVVRSKALLSSDPDWMTRMGGENLKKNLLEAARMGATSTPAGTSYFPAVADPSRLDIYKGGKEAPIPYSNFMEVDPSDIQ